MKRFTLGWVIVPAVLVSIVAAACGGRPQQAGPSSGMGPGLSIEEALTSPLSGPLLVNGYILADGDQVRLCTALAESFPPSCAGAALTVQGLDVDTIEDLSSEDDVSWTEEPVQVLGSVSDLVLTVETTAQA